MPRSPQGRPARDAASFEKRRTAALALAARLDELLASSGEPPEGLRPGADSDFNEYPGLLSFWTEILQPPGDAELPGDSWYDISQAVYADSSGDLDAMLGGFVKTHDPDLKESQSFLTRAMAACGTGNETAIDCGAGIGRVTRGLLQQHFSRVDLVEQEPKFLEAAQRLGARAEKGMLYCSALQDFDFGATYDVIWCQWVLLYLQDVDLLSLLVRARRALREGGILVVKENLAPSGRLFWHDRSDASICRASPYLELLFAEAELRIVMSELQLEWPSSLLPVRLYALQPA